MRLSSSARLATCQNREKSHFVLVPIEELAGTGRRWRFGPSVAGAPTPRTDPSAVLDLDSGEQQLERMIGQFLDVLLDSGERGLEQRIGGGVVVTHKRVVARHALAMRVQALEHARAMLSELAKIAVASEATMRSAARQPSAM